MRHFLMFLLGSSLFQHSLSGADLLVQAAGLQKEMANTKLLLLHVGGRADYESGHIAGARFVSLADISVGGNGSLRLQMPDDEGLREALLKLGVEDGSQVVVYAGNESVQSATRVWFTLEYAGLAPRLLDGGLASWKKAGGAVSREETAALRGKALTLRPRKDMIAGAEWVAAHLTDPKVAVLDARLEEFYTGKTPNQMARQGHISGAKSVPFPSLVTPGKEFLPVAELKAKLGEAKTVVTYCHIGMQATVAYFAARLAGREPGTEVKMYDGSFEEWSAKPELPVKVGEQP